MSAKKGTTPATTTPAAKPKKISREAAANQAVAEMGDRSTLSELTTKADALVVASGGESKPAAMKDAVKIALRTAEALGIVTVSKPTDLLVERVGK